MEDNFHDTLRAQLQDPAFRAQWERLQPEHQLALTMLRMRDALGLTQAQLARRAGITQADVSRLESGRANPSLRTLKRLASGLGMGLRLEFVPLDTEEPVEPREA